MAVCKFVCLLAFSIDMIQHATYNTGGYVIVSASYMLPCNSTRLMAQFCLIKGQSAVCHYFFATLVY